MEEKRGDYFPWLNVVKSLGVFLVVLGHLWYSSNFPLVNQMIYSFHMPLFFIVSGYLYKFKNESFPKFLKKKFLRVLLPAIIWMFLTDVLYIILIKQRSQDVFTSIKQLFFVEGTLAFNAPCWFFIVLFFVFLFVRLIRIDKCSLAMNSFIAVASFVLGGVLYGVGITDYFGLIKTVIALGFFLFGYCWRHLLKKIEGIDKKQVVLPILLGSLVLWVIFGGVLNQKVSFYGLELGFYPFFVLSGIFGTLFFVLVIKYIYIYIGGRLSFLERYPVVSSVFIICTHYIPIHVYARLITKLGVAYTWKFNVLTPVFVVLLMLVYYPVCIFVSKYLPVLNGQTKNRKQKQD